jgi:hypothetical protein
MTIANNCRTILAIATLFLLALFSLPRAHADQSPQQRAAEEPVTGSTFNCTDGKKLVLSFIGNEDGTSVLIWLQGDRYTLPTLPSEPGPAQIVWSDGVHSLTWSPGVQLMWMSGATHLMCGRGGHHH